MAIARAVEAVQTIAHPLDAGLRGIDGTIFTAPPADERSALRNVAVFAAGAADRSPGGTGTAAVMAVVDAMGLIGPETPFVHESLIGTRFTGRIAARTTVGDYPAIVPEIEGAAWITGEHTFVIDEDDPLKEGFRVHVTIESALPSNSDEGGEHNAWTYILEHGGFGGGRAAVRRDDRRVRRVGVRVITAECVREPQDIM